ncbi:CRISPR-associated protein Csx3 [Thermoflexus hugenholtzii]
MAHYVLRAAPDGEGDWFHEAEPRLTRQLRIKGTFDERWVDRIVQDIRRRHLPLLVDVGGMPTPEQERIFSVVTHAVLLIRDPAARPAWQELVRRYGLHLIADLDSRLEGPSEILEETPVLRGVITGLERGRMAEGPVFEALAERIAALFRYDPEELRRYHLAMAPDVDWVIDLDELARMLEVRREGEAPRWAPEDLPRMLDFLPEGKPLALYGRGPAWLYAALAVHALPASFFQFDVRLGWVEPPRLRQAADREGQAEDRFSPLVFTVEEAPGGWRLRATFRHPYVEREETEGLLLPSIPEGGLLILNGKLPLWLFTALARACADRPALAVFEPRGNQAVVIASRDPAFPVGSVWRIENTGPPG